jgi:hypothetical protein
LTLIFEQTIFEQTIFEHVGRIIVCLNPT